MAYYLAVERTPDSFEAINIKKTTKGKKMFAPNESYECSLEEIDRFTTEYETLMSLKYSLHSERKIPWANSSLALVCVQGIELKITQDILLRNSKKYLENPNLVIEYLINKFCSYDSDFTNQLSNNFPETTETRNVLEELKLEITKCIINKSKLDINNITDIANSLIYNAELTIDYQKLHNIVAFISEYENSLNQEKGYQRIKTKNT